MRFVSRLAMRHRHAQVFCVLLTGLVLSGLVSRTAWNHEQQAVQADFDAAAVSRVAALRREVDARLAMLHAAARGMERAQHDEREHLLSTAAEMQPIRMSLRWVRRLTASERPAFEHHLRIEHGAPNGIRHVQGGEIVPSPMRPEYYPVMWIAPATPENKRFLGVDTGARPESLDAIHRAERTALAAATGGLPLLQRFGTELGVMIFVPVFEPGTRKPQGFIQSLIYTSDLLEYGLKTLSPSGIHVEFRDMAEPDIALYRHVSRKGESSQPYVRPYEATINFADRTWIVRCEASSDGRGMSWYPLLVLGTGAVITVLITLLLHLYVRHSVRVEREVEHRTQALTNTTRRLQAEIEERRAAELALAVARDEALASSRLKSQFLANVSHEIRTPVNGIMGITEILAEASLSDQQRETVVLLQRCSKVLGSLIDDLLDMARIEAGTLEIRPHVFRVPDVVREAASTIEYSAREKGLSVECVLAADTGLSVSGDAGRVRQVLLNLLVNAVKFTDKGRISVIASPKEGAPDVHRFEVLDTGTGISEADQAIVFRPFVQADGSYARSQGGAGLGLAISKQLVELMGGRIGLTSCPGEGSLFWFEIPLTATPSAGPQPDGHALSSLLPAVGNKKILLAEDNAVNRKVAVWQLRKLGYDVDCAENGAEVLRSVEQGAYAAILMDCQMPVMDGFEATRLIRNQETASRNVPILALTAHAMQGARERCLQAGMDDYISKPLHIAELAQLLNKWVSDSGPASGANAVEAIPAESGR